MKRLLLPFLLLTLTLVGLTSKSKSTSTNTNTNALESRALSTNGYRRGPQPTKDWGMAEVSRWQNYPRNREVVVAIVDTGIDSKHPALKNNLWTNPGESGPDADGNPKASNGIDDDRNGFVDDVHGWNFSEDNSDISDTHGHGTHIAGIVAASPTEDSEFRGVSAGAKVMVLKYYSQSQSGDSQVRATINAFEYAIKNGAHIINYSAGGSSSNPRELAVIMKARRKNILLIAAAGNQAGNTDDIPYYPASYDLENIISVAGLAPNQDLFEASNYGEDTVDIAAPGETIYSTLPGSAYGTMSGTSQATAFVTGIAAAIWASEEKPTSIAEIKTRILASGAERPRLRKKLKHPQVAKMRNALHMKGNFRDRGTKENYRVSWRQLRKQMSSNPVINRAPSMQRIGK